MLARTAPTSYASYASYFLYFLYTSYASCISYFLLRLSCLLLPLYTVLALVPTGKSRCPCRHDRARSAALKHRLLRGFQFVNFVTADREPLPGGTRSQAGTVF